MQATLKKVFLLVWVVMLVLFTNEALQLLFPKLSAIDFSVASWLLRGLKHYVSELALACVLATVLIMLVIFARRRLVKLKVTLLICLLLSLLAVFAHSMRAASYERAISANTISAYSEFLGRYPDDRRFSPAARGALSELLAPSFQRAVKERDLEALHELVREYPWHPQAALAQQTIRRVEEKASWERATKADTESAFRSFAEEFPDSQHAPVARERLRIEVDDLGAAIARGLVTAVVTGEGLSSVKVKLTRPKGRLCRVRISPGTFFLSDGTVQNMVVTEEREFDLTESRRCEASVSTSCAQMSKPEPGGTDTFRVGPPTTSKVLKRLLEVAVEAGASEVAKQVATWVVTDNPSRRDLDETYQSGFGFGGGEPAADDEEIEEAHELLKRAGVDTGHKRLFRR